MRGKNDAIGVPVPTIDLPHIRYGKSGVGIGRGGGNDGDIIEHGDQPGHGVGTMPSDGQLVDYPLDAILKLLKEELELPDLKPKSSQTFEEIKTIYDSLSKTGPKSLLHKRRMMKECMKRCAAAGLLNKKILLPGFNTPIPLFVPINDDFRYRQYREVKFPSSNAVIFFLRDGSGSMDKTKCDIVSDISWWVELYIKAYYKNTKTVHIWHDVEAREVSSKQFYELRFGGGTFCTSSLKLMEKIINSRFPTFRWNIYGFYFGDGETMQNDNEQFAKMLAGPLGPEVLNMFGQVEILNYFSYGDSLKSYIDKVIGGLPHVKNAAIERDANSGWHSTLSEDQRNQQIKRVIKILLGKSKTKS